MNPINMSVTRTINALLYMTHDTVRRRPVYTTLADDHPDHEDGFHLVDEAFKIIVGISKTDGVLVILSPLNSNEDAVVVNFPARISMAIVNCAALTHRHGVPSNGAWRFSIIITGFYKEALLGTTITHATSVQHADIGIYSIHAGLLYMLRYMWGIKTRGGESESAVLAAEYIIVAL